MTERICSECGAAFAPSLHYQVCCSDECKRIRKRRLTRERLPGYSARLSAAAERKEKAARRKAFFAARDAAFAKAGLPVPRIVIKDGRRIEYRGRCIGGYGPSRVPHC